MWAQVAEETFQACKEVDSIGTCWSRVLPGGHEGKPQGRIAALSCLMASFPFRVGGTCARLPSPRRSEPAALRDFFCPGLRPGLPPPHYQSNGTLSEVLSGYRYERGTCHDVIVPVRCFQQRWEALMLFYRPENQGGLAHTEVCAAVSGHLLFGVQLLQLVEESLFSVRK